ncbi:hypothetical protein GH714_023261 [Hevea brasiliensis]|uniref:Uncharacterized protein n=1 Tax=Hevea brasiliensis TaxID=3981 RepID=A0A6A6KD08_HEVBR|nr:hypothetical protein GH714_023261 [Hevea brasiliensis]
MIASNAISTEPTTTAPINTLVVLLTEIVVLVAYDFVLEEVEDEFSDDEPLDALVLADCVGGDTVDEVEFELDDVGGAFETGGGGAINSVGGGGDSVVPCDAGGGTNPLGGGDFGEKLSGGGDDWPDTGGDTFFAGVGGGEVEDDGGGDKLGDGDVEDVGGGGGDGGDDDDDGGEGGGELALAGGGGGGDDVGVGELLEGGEANTRLADNESGGGGDESSGGGGGESFGGGEVFVEFVAAEEVSEELGVSAESDIILAETIFLSPFLFPPFI